MSADMSTGQPNGKPNVTAGVLKRLLQVSTIILVQAAILFASSGRVDWMMAWVYVSVYVSNVVINALVILPKSPELIAERAQVAENTKSWDRVLILLAGFSGLATLLMAGLDARFGWSPKLSLATELAGLGFLVFGCSLFSWAMASNKFFSGVVRIQKERGHAVVTTGPYQYVRHPGYVGYITFSLATPLLLGSLWALIPAAITTCIFVARTALEDKTLQEELDGYRDYAGRVRYRLLPGVW